MSDSRKTKVSGASRSRLTIGLVTAVAVAAIGVLWAGLPWQQALPGTLLTATLAALGAIDLQQWRLPDVLTLPLIWVGLLISLAGVGRHWIDAGLGVAFGYGSLALLASVYRRLRGHAGIGLGDAKALAAIGAWVGAALLPLTILMASLGALCTYALFLRRGGLDLKHALPFGPFLAVAGWVGFIIASKGWDPARALGSYFLNR